MDQGDAELTRAIGRLLAEGGSPARGVAPVRAVVRPRSVVRWFRVTGDAPPFEVVVKEPRLGTQVPGPGGAAPVERPSTGRPRLAAVPEPAMRYEAEFHALRLVAEDLARDPDPALGAVPVLGYLPDRHAIVMEAFREPTLRDLVYWRSLGGRRRRAAVERSMEHAGCWLRRYHALPAPAATTPRQAGCDEVVGLADAMLGWVAGRAAAAGAVDHAAFLRAREASVHEFLTAALPARLPVALGHGDFALRNVLVGAASRVTAIDAWAWWRPPVYEDLATFLGSLRTAMPRVLTRGRWMDEATVGRLEAAFLRGYGSDAIDRDALRAYETFLLLDRWGSVPGVERVARGSGRLRAPAMWRAYRLELDRLLGVPSS